MLMISHFDYLPVKDAINESLNAKIKPHTDNFLIFGVESNLFLVNIIDVVLVLAILLLNYLLFRMLKT